MNDNLISGVLHSKGFGSNVQSVTENDNCVVLRIQSPTGEGYMTLQMVMKGVYVMFDEFHLESCESEFKNMENVFCIDHCRQGRIEHENLNLFVLYFTSIMIVGIIYQTNNKGA